MLSATSSRIRDVEFDLQNLSIIEQHDLFTKSFTRDKRPATNWSASLASTSGREFAQSGNYSQGIRLIGTAQRIRRIAKISISNPQQFHPLAIVAIEADALGHPKGRDQACSISLLGFSRHAVEGAASPSIGMMVRSPFRRWPKPRTERCLFST
jgi:hypothetical protein